MLLRQAGVLFVAFDSRKVIQTVWAILLMAMGLLLVVKTPHAVREFPQERLLNLGRYIIAGLLILGGIKKLYALLFVRPEDSLSE